MLISEVMRTFNQDNRSRPRRDFDRRDSGRRSFDGYRREREMHKAVCSSCGKDCEVPFEPTGSKPVYCDECFRKSSGGPRRFQDRGPRRPRFERRYDSRPQNNEQFEKINRKLDKILDMLRTCSVKEEKTEEKQEEVKKPKEITVFSEKKTETPKKKASETKKKS